MAIKPTLFNTPMTQAIQAGTKTETRRVIKPQPTLDGHFWVFGDAMWSSGVSNVCPMPGHSMYNRAPCHPGDVLWVRETWADYDRYYYKATEPDAAEPIENGDPRWFKWRPSIHMPKEAARLFLRVTGVWVERLQDILAEQCCKEGVSIDFPKPKPSYLSLAYAETRLKPSLKIEFTKLWDTTIKPADLPRYGWAANPWVWVIEFERCERPEGWPGRIGP